MDENSRLCKLWLHEIYGYRFTKTAERYFCILITVSVRLIFRLILAHFFPKETRSHKCNDKPVESEHSNSVSDHSNVPSPGDENSNSLTPNRTPLQSANSSPHPPPRHRQQKMLAQSQSSHCISSSKTKPVNIINPQSGNNGYNYAYASPRNKISFKDMHTAFGRLVLRDRNLWRHQRKNSLQVENNSQREEQKQPFAEQNLLISL